MADFDVDLNNTLLKLARDAEGGVNPIVPGLGYVASWSERFVEIFAQRQRTGRLEYGLYPPEAESVWPIDDFTKGIGREVERAEAELSYWYSDGVDASHDGRVILGPEVRAGAYPAGITLINEFFFSNTGALLAVAHDADDDGHILTTTGNPASATTPVWTDAGEFAAAADLNIDSDLRGRAVVFQGTGEASPRLFVAAENGHAFQTAAIATPGTLSANAAAAEAKHFCVAGDALWRSTYDSTVHKTMDGTNNPTWGAAILVGNPAYLISGLLALPDGDTPASTRLYVLKEDGIHTITNAVGSTAGVYSQHVTPQFAQPSNPAGGGAIHCTMREYIICVYEGDLWAFNTLSGALQRIGLEKAGLPADYSRLIYESVLSDGNDLYVEMGRGSNDWLFKVLVEFGDDRILRTRWHNIALLRAGSGTLGPIAYRAGTTTNSPALMFPSPSINQGPRYVTLPMHDLPPDEDTNYRFASSGSIYLPRFADLPGENKTFLGVDLLATDIAAGQTIDAQAQTSDGGGYTSMGTWNASGDNNGERKDFASPPTTRLIDIRLDFATNDATLTPVLNRFELRLAFRVTPKRIWRGCFDLSRSETGAKTVEDLKSDLNSFANSGVLNMTDPEGVTRVILVGQNPVFVVDSYIPQGGSTRVQRYLAVVDMIETSSGATAGSAQALLGNIIMQGNLDMANYLVTNIGAAGTDFTTGGGLNLAAALDLATTVRVPDDGLIIENPADTFRYTVVGGAITANRNASLPALAASDTFVFLAETQTLTNKTLTAPTIADFTNAAHDHGDADDGGAIVPAAIPADAIDAITEIAAALKSGADLTLITGTEGSSGNPAQWNADGDLVGTTAPTFSDFTNATHAHAAAASGGTIIKTLWVQPHTIAGNATLSTNLGEYGAASLSGNAAGYALHACALPSNFNAISKAVAVVISAETGDLVWAIDTNFAADGEAHQLNTDSIARTTRAMTANQMDEVDISAAFTGVAANDRIGINFWRDGADVADTIATLYVLGVLIEYT